MLSSVIQDVLLPDSDTMVLVQFVVLIVLTIVAVVLARRERSLMVLAFGIGFFLLSMMGLRALH